MPEYIRVFIELDVKLPKGTKLEQNDSIVDIKPYSDILHIYKNGGLKKVKVLNIGDYGVSWKKL